MYLLYIQLEFAKSLCKNGIYHEVDLGDLLQLTSQQKAELDLAVRPVSVAPTSIPTPLPVVTAATPVSLRRSERQRRRNPYLDDFYVQ